MYHKEFSSKLQGQTVHEALLSRQEYELRLLDTIRKSLQNKVKSDKEYSSALLSAVALGQKIEGEDVFLNSAVTQSWKSLLESYEFLAKVIKQNAESVENQVLDKLNILYTDKRKAKKLYQDEHNRATQHFGKLLDELAKKKSEYQKNLENFKSIRSRLEEFQIKGGKDSKKVDEFREKYQKNCKKLHQTHNEYVLLLEEAAEYEKNYRTSLFPGIVENHQSLQNKINRSWKTALEDAAKHSRLCTEQLQDLENRVIHIVKGISEENYDLTDHISSSSPCSVINFDESLIHDSSGKLQPYEIIVDNLTIDWLKSKLPELNGKIEEVRDKLMLLLKSESEHDQLEDPSLTTALETVKIKNEYLQTECEEKKLMKQFIRIKFTLAGIGSEKSQLGWDSFIENNSKLECLDPKVLSAENKGGNIGASLDKLDSIKTRPSSSLSLHKKSFTNTLNSFMSHLRRKSVPTTPVLGRTVGDETFEKSTDISDIKNATNSILDEEWFHGVLPREEVVRLLRREGDFLVRETTRNDESQTVLSVAWGGHKHFIVQTTSEGHFRFEGPSFPTIQELIKYQYESGQPVTTRSGAILKKPILRENWELNNDDVQLLDKIGRGNFGDVYKAKLKSNNQSVAVKTCRVALPDEHKRKFLQEGRILKQYDHPNIVKLIGICVQKQPIMIVMELVPGGSLLTFLRNNATTLTGRQLLNMCRDVAAGMRYLESKNCIHRDLAARNCLIGYENIVKISDFGMSREEEEYIVSDGMKQIPIKWTAPEALNFGKYTSLCDVWSYGVLTWEVFSKGSVPYPGLSNSKAREKIDSGYRMSAPQGTPQEMYALMLRCWEYDPDKRPHFHEIYTIVNDLRDKLYEK